MPSPFSSSQTSNYSLSGNPLLDALLTNNHGTQIRWGNAFSTEVNLTYSFPWTSSSLAYWDSNYPQNEGAGPDSEIRFGLNSTQIQATRIALQSWENVAAINFIEVAETSSNVGDLRFTFSSFDIDSEFSGFAYFPSRFPSAADVWLNSDVAGESYSPGTIEQLILIHEIGHALGLDHPFVGEITLPTNLDAKNYTVMSYTEPVNVNYRSTYTIKTPMVYDILAIQYLYGANTSYNTGNDIYSYVPSQHSFEVIWDAGGIDTIDISLFSSGSYIDLRDGSYSSLSYSDWNVSNNLGIAFNAIIENAIGGSGNDIIFGNDVSNALSGGAGDDILRGYEGDDTLNGGTGSDTMYGGLGADTFYVDSINDIVIEYGLEGLDTIISSINYTLEGGDLENLTLQGSAIFGTGNSYDNEIIGTSSANTLYGLDGDDSLVGGGGNDTLYGGNGLDHTHFNGNRADYSISKINDQIIVSDSQPDRDGTDILLNIEWALFSDGSLDLGLIPSTDEPPTTTSSTTTASVQSLYTSILRRDGSDAHVASFVAVIDSGVLTLAQAKQSFIDSTETNAYVDPVIRLYQAAFGRQPDTAGFTTQVQALKAAVDGGTDIATATANLAAAFTVSQEFTNRFGTSTTVDQPYLTALYLNVLGRTPADAEVDAWIATGQDRATVLRGFTDSPEYVANCQADVDQLLENVSNGIALDPTAALSETPGGSNSSLSIAALTAVAGNGALVTDGVIENVAEDFFDEEEDNNELALLDVNDSVTLLGVTLGDLNSGDVLTVRASPLSSSCAM